MREQKKLVPNNSKRSSFPSSTLKPKIIPAGDPKQQLSITMCIVQCVMFNARPDQATIEILDDDDDDDDDD